MSYRVEGGGDTVGARRSMLKVGSVYIIWFGVKGTLGNLLGAKMVNLRQTLVIKVPHLLWAPWRSYLTGSFNYEMLLSSCCPLLATMKKLRLERLLRWRILCLIDLRVSRVNVEGLDRSCKVTLLRCRSRVPTCCVGSGLIFVY